MDLIGIGSMLGGLGQAVGGAAGLFGGGGNNNNFYNSLAIMREQAQLQREFAQNGIRWKVEDAKAAGLHPIYALGGGGASYSPSAVSVGSDTSADLGRDLGNMGAGLGRAVAAAGSKEDRAATEYTTAMRALGLQRAGLENQNLELQIAASRAALQRAQLGPPMPTGISVGSGASPGVGIYDAKPPEVLNSQPGNPAIEAGPNQPGNRNVAIDKTGQAVVTLPSKEMQFDELTTPGTASWHFWNSIAPWMSQARRDANRPPMSQLPKGYDSWMWTPFGYVPTRNPRSPIGRNFREELRR